MLLSAQNVYLRIFIFIFVVFCFFLVCCRCSWLLLKTFVSPFAFRTLADRRMARYCECQCGNTHCWCCAAVGGAVIIKHGQPFSQSALHTLCFAVWFSLLWKSFANRHLTSTPRSWVCVCVPSYNNHMYSNDAVFVCVCASFVFSRTRMPIWSDTHWTNITAY